MSEMALKLIRQAKAEGWKTLDLRNTGIVGSLPKEIGILTDMEELVLDGTHVSDIDSLDACISLVSLDLAGTLVESIEVCSKLNRLRKLIIRSTKISNLKPLENSFSMMFLDISSSKVENLEALTGLFNLTTIRAYITDVSDLNPLSHLVNLQILVLWASRITDLTPLSLLTNLRHLDVSSTKVRDLSPISSHFNLETLDFENTGITDLSPVIGLSNLRFIDFRKTAIADLTPLSNLRLLQEIRMGNTLINSLEPLRGLNEINYLDIRDSRISDLSPLRSKIERGLKVSPGIEKAKAGVNVLEWQIKDPPAAIVKMGTEAILAYWEEQDRIGSTPLKEIKIFLLGNSTAGKSTLREALINGLFDEELHSTHGAELARKWQDGEIRINIWDFGGQEYFHATYRLLMNDKAVYALLIDPKHDYNDWIQTPVRYPAKEGLTEEGLEHFQHRYWLETIRRHAPKSKVHVVWNKMDLPDRAKGHIDDHDRNLFPAGQMQEFEISLWAALKEQHKVKRWERKWEDFVEALREHIADRLVGERVLSYWPVVRKAVENLGKSTLTITRRQFDDLVLESDPNRKVDLFIYHLRDTCGSILYWEHHATLSDKVFINPNRLNQLIYAVLSPEVKQNGGRIHRERVRSVVAVNQKRQDHALADDLIEVMLEFQIIFAVRGQAHTYIAPQYLPLPTPDGLSQARQQHNIPNRPQLWLRLEQSLQPLHIQRYVFPAFITLAGPFAAMEECWKTAVIYGEDPHKVLVAVDYATHTITLNASQPDPLSVPTTLRDALQDLLQVIGTDLSVIISTDADTEAPTWIPYNRLADAAQRQLHEVASEANHHVDIQPWLGWLPDRITASQARRTPPAGVPIVQGTVPDPVLHDKVDQLLKITSESKQQGQDNQKAVINKLESIDQKFDAQLNRILAEIQSLQDPNSKLHDDLQTIFQRINDNAHLGEGLLQHLLSRQSEIELAIQQGLAALPETQKPNLPNQVPLPPTPSMLEKLNFIKLKLSTLTLVAAALAATTPDAPTALPALLAASTINVEATLPDALRGVWKVLRKIAEPFRMDQE